MNWRQWSMRSCNGKGRHGAPMFLATRGTPQYAFPHDMHIGFAHDDTTTAAVIAPLQQLGNQSAVGDLRTKCAVQSQGKRIRKARLRDRTVAEVLHVED